MSLRNPHFPHTHFFCRIPQYHADWWKFISLFKDTSLLAIVGLVELLGISQSILANPKFIGRYAEVYLFIAVIYWLFCYLMSLASRQLEQKLNTSKT